MRMVVPVLGAVGCILLGAALHAVLGADPATPNPVGDPTLDGRFDRLEARLEGIETSLAALRQAPVRVLPVDAAGTGGSDARLAGAAAARNPSSRTRPSTTKPTDLPIYARQSTEKLWLDALAHSGPDGDPAAAALRWQALLLRKLDPEKKADAYYQLGMAWRNLGEHEKSLAALQEHLGAVPRGSSEESQAQFFVGWTRYLSKDFRGALADAERVQRHPEVVPLVRANARWMQALALRDLGDTGESSRVLEGMVRDYADDDALRFFADRARTELAQE